MSTITITRPNLDDTGASNFRTLTGGTTLYTAINDSSTSTGIIKYASATGIKKCSFLFTDSPTLTSSQKVRRVRIVATVTAPLSSSHMDIQLGTKVQGTNYYTSSLAIRGQYTSNTVFTSGWFAYSPDGNPWNQTSINGLRAQITEYGENSGTVSAVTLRELYIEVDVNTCATVSVVSPTSISAYQTVSWNFTDPDGDDQDYYRAKIFSSAQYSITGFDVETSPSTWDSGVVASSDTIAVSTDLIPNGLWHHSVKSGKNVAGDILWSTWDDNYNNINLSPIPSVPTVSLSSSSSLNLSAINVTGSNYSSGNQTFQLQRSDDGGVTYSDIRNGTSITPTANAVDINDYESPRNVTVYYRARAVGIVGENYYVSAWSSSVSAFISNDNNWWFKAVNNPSYNAGAVRVMRGASETIVESNGTFRPIGRNTSIVVSGSIYGDDGNYTIMFTTDAEYNAFDALLKSQDLILVQDPYNTQKYVKLVQRSSTLGGTAGRRLREVKVDYIEVAST